MEDSKTDIIITHDPPQIFDHIFKRLMHLSSSAIILFINALFGTAYPLDSTVEYLSTEHITDTLNQLIGDILIRINGLYKYWVEAQMSDDTEMGFRMWRYSYTEGLTTKSMDGNLVAIDLVPAVAVYLEPTAATPDTLPVRIRGMDGTVHIFTYPVFKLLDHSIADLEEQNLSILLPFYLLKLRKRVKAAGGKERAALSPEMKGLVAEITEAVERSERKGQMSKEDMRVVLNLMGKLYNDLYKPYPEFKETNEMVEEMLLLEVDEAELAGKAKGEAKKAKEIAQKLITEGWSTEKIATVTDLDLSTVESLYAGAHA